MCDKPKFAIVKDYVCVCVLRFSRCTVLFLAVFALAPSLIHRQFEVTLFDSQKSTMDVFTRAVQDAIPHSGH